MKKFFLALCLVFAFLSFSCFAEESNLLIDDFESVIVGGAEGTVDFGSGNGSEVKVTADTNIKESQEQSLKIEFNAVPGGYMWIARGFELDAKNSSWLKDPKDIDWGLYNAISFYMYGANSGAKVAFDIKDNGNEMWRFVIEDNFSGWKKITLLFGEFFARGDWQPDNADGNMNLDFPLKSYQFEPLPEGKGILYFDKVELTNK